LFLMVCLKVCTLILIFMKTKKYYWHCRYLQWYKNVKPNFVTKNVIKWPKKSAFLIGLFDQTISLCYLAREVDN
jgi:hypothetical protein